jgi:hypothetical protein
MTTFVSFLPPPSAPGGDITRAVEVQVSDAQEVVGSGPTAFLRAILATLVQANCLRWTRSPVHPLELRPCHPSDHPSAPVFCGLKKGKKVFLFHRNHFQRTIVRCIFRDAATMGKRNTSCLVATEPIFDTRSRILSQVLPLPLSDQSEDWLHADRHSGDESLQRQEWCPFRH